MSSDQIDNIYAPPNTDVDIEESDETTYLEYDGYSERGMLLCNEHFQSPRVNLKSGVPVGPDEKAKRICITRYLPSIKESTAVQHAWIIRVLLIIAYFLVQSGPLSLAVFLIIFITAHRLLNHFSANKVYLEVYLSKSFLRTRKILLILFSCLTVVSASMFLLSLLQFESKVFVATYAISIILLTRIVTNICYILTFQSKKGDFYYLKGAHPHFLAALPLRSLQ